MTNAFAEQNAGSGFLQDQDEKREEGQTHRF
jgi:hypothetical protein